MSPALASHRFRVYGLTVTSHWSLCCPIDTGSGDAQVELYETTDGSLFHSPEPGSPSPSHSERWFHYSRLPDGSDYLRWTDLFEFLVDKHGRRIIGRAINGPSQEVFQTYLLSQVLSFALLKQGFEPLHATTVVIHDQAVALLGDSGYGKSSLGAAFLRAGCRMLTDDLLMLEPKGTPVRAYLAHPGPPRVKLYPEVARTLLGDRADGVPMNPDTSKRIIPLPPDLWSHEAYPLTRLYLLPSPDCASDHPCLSVTTVPQRQAILDLLANTFNTIVTDPDRLQRQFDLVAELARTVPVKALTYPRSLARIHHVVETIQRDVSR